MYKFKKNFLCAGILGCLSNVILGFISRIHAKQPLSRHYRACPDNLDPRDGLFVTPEDDKGLEYFETAESGVDKVVSSCEKNPNCT